jgi:hypothetical protein
VRRSGGTALRSDNLAGLDGSVLDNELAGVGHGGIRGLFGRTVSGWDVGLEHVRQRVEVVLVVGAARDLDRSTVHVHFCELR